MFQLKQNTNLIANSFFFFLCEDRNRKRRNKNKKPDKNTILNRTFRISNIFFIYLFDRQGSRIIDCDFDRREWKMLKKKTNHNFKSLPNAFLIFRSNIFRFYIKWSEE